MTGELGLNIIPSARMSPLGTIRSTISREKNYTHATAGFQIANRLYLGLRQTAESKNLNSEATHLYPSLDAKWMIYKESRLVPQISVGVQSAFGHKRMAAEYLAMSKRYENFDFTMGFGWGRMATRGGLPNPILFNNLSGNKQRHIDGESPNSPANWFQGDMGIFGGVEYATAIEGLSLKADWSSDGWKAEKNADNQFKAPAPLSVGFSYRPLTWVDVGMSYAGNDSVMARLSLTGNASKWPLSNSSATQIGESTPTEKNFGLSHIHINENTISANLRLDEHLSTPLQIGQAATFLLKNATGHPHQILLHVGGYGLNGYSISLNRADLEKAMADRGSFEEIWKSSFISYSKSPLPWAESLSEIINPMRENHYQLTLQNDASLSEEDSGLLYRTGLIGSVHQNIGKNFISYQSLRLNLSDNLDKLNSLREGNFFPVRENIDQFTQNRVLLERNYFMGLTTIGQDIYAASSIGYLEEMYMGLSGEVLYRPFDSNWAIGLETALAFKRDPMTFSALGLNGDRILTGFINGYYEVPNTGITFETNIGRFLAGDIGASFKISNEFLNHVKISSFISASNRQDLDIYGGKTNIHTGISLSLPLGNLQYLPNGSEIITNFSALGRQSAQQLDNPTNLYERTEPLSYRHLTQHWSQLLPNGYR